MVKLIIAVKNKVINKIVINQKMNLIIKLYFILLEIRELNLQF